MPRTGSRFLALALGAALALGFSACDEGGGGGVSGGGGTPPPTTQTTIFVKDLAPVPLSDGRSMFELFLRVKSVALVDTAGTQVDVPLAGMPTPPFADFDLLTLDDTATLLAVGAVPNGTYRKLIFTLDQQSCSLRADAAAPGGTVVPLAVPDPTFDVEFFPVLAIGPGLSSPILLDIRPDRIVDVVVPLTSYRLENNVDALVVGPFGTAPSLPGILPVRDIEGIVTATGTCPTFTLNLVIAVDTSAAFILDEDTGQPLAGGCAAIAVGDEVEVELGILTVSTAGAVSIAATLIEVDKGAGQRPPRVEVELKGFIANLNTAATPATFDLVRGPFTIANVLVPATAKIEDDDGRTIPITSLMNGDEVEVEGTVLLPLTTPLQIVADEVEEEEEEEDDDDDADED